METLYDLRGRMRYARRLLVKADYPKAIEIFGKLLNSVEDKKLKKEIELQCNAYGSINKKNEESVLADSMSILDKLEKHFVELKEKERVHFEKINTKVDKVINKCLTSIFIDKGDLIPLIIKRGISLEQLEKSLIEIRDNFDFFQKEYYNTAGMNLFNFVQYAYEAIYLDENEWKGTASRNKLTREFKLLVN